MIKVIFHQKKNTKVFNIEKNKTILDLSRRENLNMEGSCDGSMACSTCLIMLHENWISKLPAPCVEEKEMLSLLSDYKENIRLGCQVVLTENLNGLQFSLPDSA